MAILQGPALQAFLSYSVRGFTIRRLRQLMEKDGHSLTGIPDQVLIQLQLDHGAEISESRDGLDRSTLERYGLSRSMERIRRMCEAAEAIEPHITTSPKWSGEYRRYLAQIRSELEPFGIEVSPSDKWADLLMRLSHVAQGDLGTEEADS